MTAVSATPVTTVFTRALRAEGSKAILRLITWLQYLAGIIVICAIMAFQFGAAATRAVASGDTTGAIVFSQPEVISLGWLKLGLAFLLIWSSWILTSEFGTTLGASLLAVPSRARLLATKSVLTAGATAGWIFVGVPAMCLVATLAGASPDPAATVTLAVRVAVGAALLSVLAVGLVALTGSFTVSLVVWILSLGFEEAISIIGPLRPVAGFLPLTNLWNWSDVTVLETSDPPFGPTLSLVWLAVLAGAFLALGTRRVRRFID